MQHRMGLEGVIVFMNKQTINFWIFTREKDCKI